MSAQAQAVMQQPALDAPPIASHDVAVRLRRVPTKNDGIPSGAGATSEAPAPRLEARETVLREQAVPKPARRVFPVAEFASELDPAVVKARYLVGPTDPMMVFVGDLDDRHGPDLLIRAMPAILKNHPQVRLVIVGDGQLMWPLKVMSRYMLLDYAIRIVGHVAGRDVRELIAAADVIAVPSRARTEDWQILAGWSARRPVVATHAVAASLCKHEEDSVLVYGNAGSCVWGIERILYDSELGRRIGQAGHQKVVEGILDPPAAEASTEV